VERAVCRCWALELLRRGSRNISCAGKEGYAVTRSLTDVGDVAAVVSPGCGGVGICDSRPPTDSESLVK
jgi:hypothetical protein